MANPPYVRDKQGVMNAGREVQYDSKTAARANKNVPLRYQVANDLRDRANAASQLAAKTNDPVHHQAAADLHFQAGQAFQKLNGGNMDNVQAQAHMDRSANHSAAVQRFNSNTKGLVASGVPQRGAGQPTSTPANRGQAPSGNAYKAAGAPVNASVHASGGLPAKPSSLGAGNQDGIKAAVLTGPSGGRYYIAKNGKKVYVKKI